MTGPALLQTRFRVAPPVGPTMAGGGAALGAGVVDPRTIILPAEHYAPAGSTPIFLSAEAGIVGGGTIVTPAGLQLQLPSDCVGVIKSIELLLDAITIASSVIWTLLINGNPVQGMDSLTILARNGAASVSSSVLPGQLTIPVPQGGTIGMRIRDVDGGPYTVGAELSGWFWPAARTPLASLVG